MPERQATGRISSGDRFGSLTVLWDTGVRKYHCVVWRCCCELCGGEIDLTSQDLNGRGLTDCGCKTLLRRKREKIKCGDAFGLLTVFSDSGERKGTEILWRCRCRCGNEVTVHTTALRLGKVTDCGCVSSREKNLLGRQFGRLTVIGDEGNRNGEHVWRCRCECKNECLVTSSHLTHGQVKSCGCLHKTAGKDSLRLVDGTSVTKLEARRRDSDKLTAANTSGYNGVYPQISHGKKTGRWVAQIGFKGKKYYLGAFDRAEDAAEIRRRAEEKLYDGLIRWYYDEYLPPAEKIAEYGEPSGKGRGQIRTRGGVSHDV